MAIMLLPISIVVGFITMPTLADSNYKKVQLVKMEEARIRAENLEPTTTVNLTRVTVKVSRTQARKALESPYSKFFDAEALAFLVVHADGWDKEQWECLRNLWNKESRFNPNAKNKRSTAYGIPQFLDSTWELYGLEKTSDAKEQIQAGLIYIDKRYGSACNAWNHWERKHWY